MPLSFDAILSRFPEPKRTGKEWRTICPVHGDRTPSLDIAEGDSTVALFRCRTHHCSASAILQAVGLAWADILPERPRDPSWERQHAYRDASGALKYEVVGKRLPDGKKTFKQRHANGNGDMAWGLKGVEPLLYRLHELGTHRHVWIVEGEKCADTLWTLGVPATCNSGGAGQWGDGLAAQLVEARVARVTILPDNDDPGRAHAAAVLEGCQRAGIKARVLDLVQGFPIRADIVQWLEAGHTVDELRTLSDPYPLQFMAAALQTDMSPPRWIVHGLIPAGSLNFLVAKPKVGKTTLARSLALAVAQGREWLGYATAHGEVWYLAFEGRLADHMSHFVQLGVTIHDPLAVQEQRPFPGHLDAMFETMRERKPSLVVIDHMQLALQLPKMNDVGLVTLALQPFIEFTRETGCAVLFLAHARKGQSGFGDEDAIDALAGAGAFGAACDTYILLKKSRGTSGAYRTIETVQRVGESLDPTVLEFSKDTGLLRFAGSAHGYREDTIASELIAVLTAHGEPMGDFEWLAQIPGHKATKLAARTKLLRANKIRRVAGTGKKGDPYRYWVTGNIESNSVDSQVDTAVDIAVPFGSNSVPLGKSDLFEV